MSPLSRTQSQSINSGKVALLVLALALVSCAIVQAKLIGRSRYHEDYIGPYNGPYGAGATGERAIVTVRGVRSPYDGRVPSKIAIEDDPYRGPYPRGVYDRLDGYNRGRMPVYPRPDFGYGGHQGGMYGAQRRRDFLDPDFGFKGSLNLASRKKSNCKLQTDADSEIPELGLDSAHLNVDCELNPTRIANAAVRVARTYGKYRRGQRRQPYKSGTAVKHKRTRINIDTEYDRSQGAGDVDDDEDDAAATTDDQQQQRYHPQQGRDDVDEDNDD